MAEKEAAAEKKAANIGEERILAPLLSVASSPHIRTSESISKIMWTVNATLIPVALWGVYIFGWRALAQIILCGITAMLCEAGIMKIRKLKNTWLDGSAFLTGILLAFCIPVGLPYWMSVLGVIFAVAIAKQAFGGLGQNIFNPAHAGRAFLLASFPVQMTLWPFVPTANRLIDATTTSTPLKLLKESGGINAVIDYFGGRGEMYKALFFGNMSGCIGEVSAFLIIIGGIYLIAKKYIFWQTPVAYVATVAILAFVTGGDPLFHVLSGGLMLGAFYMLTDMVTSPITVLGQIIFAAGAGVLVFLIRKYGSYPEGVCYSILLMNCVTPLIDKYCKPKRRKLT